MRRMHINIGVENIEQSIKFYNVLFGAEPTKTRDDYAKWMLDDPRMNFAISTHTSTRGVDHLGLQVDDDSELEELRERLRGAEVSTFDEGEAVCCYAHSEKSWVRDPSGVAWEAFRTMDDVQLFSAEETSTDSACCAADARPESNCCAPSSQGSRHG